MSDTTLHTAAVDALGATGSLPRGGDDTFDTAGLAQPAMMRLGVASLLVALSLGCRAGSVSSDEPGFRSRPEALDPAPVPDGRASRPGGLIVKLVPAAGQVLDRALEAGRSVTDTGLAWLDHLDAQYGVTAIEPLLTHRPDIEAVRTQYPERAKRAPPDARVPTLRHLYTLTLPPDANVLQAARDYAAEPDVEYAHPNYLATVQPKTLEPAQ